MRLLLLLALLAAPARAWELQLASPPDWALGAPLSAGRLLPNFQLHYRAGALQLRAEGQLQGVGFSSERFSVARLSGHIRLQARQRRNGWQGSLQLTLNGGELVWDALYLNFDQLASQLSGEFTIRPGHYHFRNIQMETPRNSLRAEVLITPKRKRFNIEDIRGDAEALYQNYAKPFLGDSAFNEMSLSGRIGGNGLYDNGLRSFNVVLHHISIRDGQRRFQVDDLDGQLGNDGRPSRLRWAGARWRAIPIGRSEARFTLRGRQLTLGAPLRIPLADGALLIRRLQPQGGGYRVDAELEPLTLAALLATGRLGTPVDVFLRLERYAAGLNAKRWKETGEPGVGLLYDLGPHLFDMALRLFGRPQSLAADVRRQHPGALSDDNFTVNLYYANGLKIVLGASKYAREPAPFLVCHGTAASYVKAQPDNQEGLLAAGVLPRGDWNRERPCDWGLLHDEHGRQPLASVPGHYGAFYANFYEALRGRAPLAVQKAEVLAVLELLELSGASAEQGRRLPV